MSTDSALRTDPEEAVEESPVRGDLSVFLATGVGKDPARVYKDSLESIELADALGYSFAWVAEAHFNAHIGLPSALSLLAAATQLTDRIRLGTAVVPLAFDNPLRLAETAALVHVLSDHRLEFGVGKGNPFGFSTDAYNAFGLREEDRNDLFVRALAVIRDALSGPVTAGDKEVDLYPPAEDLLHRIWQATGDHATAAAAGAAGDGLLLFRTSPEGAAGDVQSPLIDSYLRSVDRSRHEPRIGVSRSVLLAGSREEAVAVAKADFEARADDHPRKPEGTDTRSIEEYLIGFDIAFGSVEDVVGALNCDAAVARSTNYLLSLPFAPTGSPYYREGLELLADEVHPRLRRDPYAFTPRTSGPVPGDARTGS
jgi:alkanesulfonate monooxygenase SsuD/methylene tetrahydromethanopterin reductase-like flavin-dependent oxidoreductase (luciferase family)